MALILFILILDLLVIVDVARNYKAIKKTVYILCILLLPIVGIMIYYATKDNKYLMARHIIFHKRNPTRRLKMY